MTLQEIFNVRTVIACFIGFIVGKFYDTIKEIIENTRKSLEKAQKNEQKKLRKVFKGGFSYLG